SDVCSSDLRRQLLQLAAGVVALPAMPRIASALDHPTRSVHLIVGFSAGGTQDTVARRGLMTRRSRSFGTAAAIGALVSLVCCDAATAQGAPPPAVSVRPVQSRQITATGDFVGRVTAINKVDIVARIVGFIKERNFTEGQQVKTGDLLFRIEPDTYQAAVEQQKANLAKAKATQFNAALQLQRAQELAIRRDTPQSTVDQRTADEKAAQAD